MHTQQVPTLFYAPYLYEIRITAEAVVLRHEVYDVVRTVPLGPARKRVEATGEFGSASARIDGDVLVIDSSEFPASRWGLAMAELDGGAGDIPSSNQKKLTERYSTSDGKTLIVEYTLEDCVFMTEPYRATVEFARVADETPLYPYRCEVDSASRYDRDSFPVEAD